MNIPTAELETFAADDEQRAEDAALPARPVARPAARLEGQGRAGRAADLEVPAVPIYIQEKIEPQAIIEDLRRPLAGGAAASRSSTSSATSTGIEFEERVDFYQHAGKWSNRMILGDSLLVMTASPRRRASRARSRRSTSTRPTASSSAQLAGLHAEARREGRQGSRTPPASPSRSAPSATPGSSASTRTSATCATGSSWRASCLTESRLDLRPDRRRERPPRPSRARRGVRQRELRRADHLREDERQSDGDELSSRGRLTTCSGTRRIEAQRQVPTSSIADKESGDAEHGVYTG